MQLEIDLDTREQQWLTWLVINKRTTESIVQEAHHFLDDTGERPPLALWIATYGTLAGYDAICDAISNYLNPQSIPAVVIPPPPERVVRDMVPSSPRDDLLDALIRRLDPQQAPKQEKVGFFGMLAFFAGIMAIFVMLAVLVNTGLRLVFDRDVPNEIHILTASRTIANFALDEDGKYLGWQDGAIVFYSHAYSCVPAFRSVNAQGLGIPPPSSWPASDAEQLLKSEYLGCAPSTRYLRWGGYWGDTPWGVLAIFDQDWLVAQGITTKDKPLAQGYPLWVEMPRLGVSKKDLLAMNTTDLSAKGTAGQTGEVQVGSPTDVPRDSTATPWQAVPTNAPAPQQVSDQGAAPPAQPAPEQPPAIEQGGASPVPTAPQPTEAQQFATQTPMPKPTITPITPVVGTAVPAFNLPTERPVGKQSRYTANDGTPYSDACVALEDKYSAKTDGSPIPTGDFVAMTNCGLHGRTG